MTHNPYNQFTIRARLNPRLCAAPTDAFDGRVSFHRPVLETVRLMAPQVPVPVAGYDDQSLYSTLGSITPAFGPQRMMNSNSGVAVIPPVVPLGMGQPVRMPLPANLRGGTLGMYPGDVMQQFVAGNTARSVLRNRASVMHQQAASVRHPYNVPSFPVVSANTVSTLTSDVDVPFREVQWMPVIPSGVTETGVPQVPYAVEIKPENCEAPPQEDVLSGLMPMIQDAFTVPDESCKTEFIGMQRAPSVYLDVAMDSSNVNLNPTRRTNFVTVTPLAKKAPKRKVNRCKSKSTVKVLKLPLTKPCSVSLVRIDSCSVSHCRSGVEEIYVDDEEPNEEPGAGSMTEVEEVISEQDVPLPAIQEEVDHLIDEEVLLASVQINTGERDSDQLIASDEDVGEEYPPYDDDNCSTNEGVHPENPGCYEVTMNSDALPFDMECDGQKDGETLRVLLPTTTEPKTLSCAKTAPAKKMPARNSTNDDDGANDVETLWALLPNKQAKTTHRKTASAKKLMKNYRPIKPKQPSSSSDSNVVPASVEEHNVDDDIDDDDDDVIIESELLPSTSPEFRSERLAAAACKEKLFATQARFESVKIKKCENLLLGIPLQSSFFRFEAHSSEVYRLLSMDKSLVPRDILAGLTDLVASVDPAVDRQPSCSDESIEVACRIPHGESRKLLFQCLFCPYGELSAKRIMAHVKQQHSLYATFIQRALLPSREVLLHIHCRHCNFVAYDSAAMFIHFATYHKVPGILLTQPKDIEQDPDWAPALDPGAHAKEFPFYSCPNCRYVDVEWNRMIQHMLKQHSTELVFFGCIVRLMMYGRTTKYMCSFTYESLARQEKCKVARRQIYACVSCRFFSFYPTYAFCHYVINHCSLEMLYVCAATPSCAKRCSSLADCISHIQDVHVSMKKKLQYRCSATLIDALSSTQVDVGPGELVAADVPLHVTFQPAFIGPMSEPAIEINSDEDDDEDDVPLSKRIHPLDVDHDDVEPDSGEEEIGCIDQELSSKSAAVEKNVIRRKPSDLSCSGSLLKIKTLQLCRKEYVEADVVMSSNDEAADVEADDEMKSSSNQPLTEPVNEQNAEPELSHHVEDETSNSCETQREVSEQDLNGTELPLVQTTLSACTPGPTDTELASSDDANSIADADRPVAESVGELIGSCCDDNSSSTELVSVQNSPVDATQTNAVESAEDQTCSDMGIDQPTDTATTGNDLDHETNKLPSEEEVCDGYTTQTEAAVANPQKMDASAAEPELRDTSHTNAVKSAEGRACSDMDVSANTNGKGAASLTDQETNNLPPEEVERGYTTATDTEVANPQKTDASAAEQELVSSDQRDSIKIFDDLLPFDNDALFSPQLPSKSSHDRRNCMLGLEEELLLAEQLAVDDLQLPDPCNNNMQHAMCSAVSSEQIVNEAAVISSEDPCLAPCQDTSLDALCTSDVAESEQLNISASSWLDPVDNSVQGHTAEENMVSSESRDLETMQQAALMNEQSTKKSTDSDSKLIPVNRFRFKSLASFRFPASCSFAKKPS